LLRIARTWSNGDQVVLELPMGLTVTRWEKNRNSVSVQRGPLTYSIKVGEKYVRQHPERKNDKWPAYEIIPTTPWNYGLVLNEKNPAKSFEVLRWNGQALPAQPFIPEPAPIELRAKARRIPAWKLDSLALVGKLQPSPVKSDEPLETVTLIPMGGARLRITSFPVIGKGDDAQEWKIGE
jgi:hypothetical protein